MSKKYQKNTPVSEAVQGRLAVPDQVLLSLGEVAASAREGLLALAVGTGLQVLTAMFEADAQTLGGPVGRHHRDRAGYRHGVEHGSVTLGGRRVPITRPRVRAADGSGELRLPTCTAFSDPEVLGARAMEKLLAGLSTRRYPGGLEPVGTKVSKQARSTSQSAVSRKFLTATETALAKLLAADLSGVDLVALMIDGVRFGEHLCVVALGIGGDGVKPPWPWSRAPPSTPPPSPSCWWTCASGAWMSPGPSWWSSTAPRRWPARSSASSTGR